MKKCLMLFVFLFVGLFQVAFADPLDFTVKDESDLYFGYANLTIPICSTMKWDAPCAPVCDVLIKKLNDQFVGQTLKPNDPNPPKVSLNIINYCSKQIFNTLPLGFRSTDDNHFLVWCKIGPTSATYAIKPNENITDKNPAKYVCVKEE